MNIEQARVNMINSQIRTNTSVSEDILNLIKEVPRELFVPRSMHDLAFADIGLPIGHGQVMMLPADEIKMLQALAIKKSDTIFEIGTGTGYVTALLAHLGRHVYSVDIFPDFIEHAGIKLNQLNINNVTLSVGDASRGFGQEMTYDVIVISASMPLLPKTIMEQLVVTGRLFLVLGNAPAMSACIFTRLQMQEWQQHNLFETVLPPLINAPQPELFSF